MRRIAMMFIPVVIWGCSDDRMCPDNMAHYGDQGCQPIGGFGGTAGNGQGGNAGEAGNAGNGGEAGNAGNGGIGGTAGNGGTGGTSGNGGIGGTAGNGGTGGSGGGLEGDPCVSNNDCQGLNRCCNNVCAAIDTDKANCGTCNNACGGGTPFCMTGVCTAGCSGVYADCFATDGQHTCRNLSTDPAHCDSCVIKCGIGQVCVPAAPNTGHKGNCQNP